MEIEKITLRIGEHSVELSKDEAKELYDLLGTLLGESKPEKEYVSYPVYYPQYVYPTTPYYPYPITPYRPPAYPNYWYTTCDNSNGVTLTYMPNVE